MRSCPTTKNAIVRCGYAGTGFTLRLGIRETASPQLIKGHTMKTTLATAGLLLGALLLPAAVYSADKAPAASPTSPNETVSGSEPSKATGKKMGHGSSQPVDDTWITTKIKSSYATDKTVGTLNIEVTTIDGVVTLGGEAKTKKEADKAVAIARKIKGVKSVKNMI